MSDAADNQINVLIIDDEPDVRDLLVDVVHRREHQAIAVGSAEEGLELLPSWTFQIAFIDQNLPGMDGLLVGEYLRRNNPDMMIALITGEVDPKLERRACAMAIRYVPKPFRVQQIFDLIDDAVCDAIDREERRRRRDDPDFAPPIAQFVEDLGDIFDIPSVPNRIEDGLVQTIKRALNELRSAARYNERARVTALAGLLTAKVLNTDLPKVSDGRTLFEVYDELMRAQGRRSEFEITRRSSQFPPPECV